MTVYNSTWKKNQQCKIKYLNLGTGDQGGGSQLRPFVRSFVSALATAWADGVGVVGEATACVCLCLCLTGSNGVSVAMESLTTQESVGSPMDITDSQSSQGPDKKTKLSPALQAQIKQLKPPIYSIHWVLSNLVLNPSG
jgi:hypothetical protein